MVNNRLINKELKWYKDRNIDMKWVKYNKDIFPNLFKKYNNYGMCENYYCCHGLENSCWVEVVEEGNWNLTLEKVKRDILRNIKEDKKYLYKDKRVYIGEKDDICYVYIYLRDKSGVDYSIWFDKNESIEN